MLYDRNNPPPKRNNSKILLAIILGVALAGVTAASLFSHSQATTPPNAQIPVSTPELPGAWKIQVLSDTSERGAQHFSGRYAPGKMLFIPAGAKFRITPEPAGSAGFFVEASGSANWDHEGGELDSPSDANVQQGRAPMHAGLYELSWRPLQAVPASAPLKLEVMVLAHADTHSQGDRTFVKVNGKSIGGYADPAKSSVRRVRENAAQYIVPEYFGSIADGAAAFKLGPDFELGQLIAFKDYHGPDGKKVFTTQRHIEIFPPRPELIDKLIKLRERLRAKGVTVTKFWVTSGFRTPDYNRSIGGAAYSRHCYGDAVDICIDEDNDKHMDDLNGDGRIDKKDGVIIGDACRELEAEGAVVPGGIGVYEWDSEDSVRSHVHIDCRGYISRWGQIGAGKYRKSFCWWPKSEFQEDDGGD